jgi:hypothetical protein
MVEGLKDERRAPRLMCLKKWRANLLEEKFEYLSGNTKFWGREVSASYRALVELTTESLRRGAGRGQ